MSGDRASRMQAGWDFLAKPRIFGALTPSGAGDVAGIRREPGIRTRCSLTRGAGGDPLSRTRNVLFITCHRHTPPPLSFTSRQKNIGKCCNYAASVCALHGRRRRAVPGLIFQLYHILVLFEDGGSSAPPVSHN